MKDLTSFIKEGYAATNNEWKVSNAGKGKFGFMWYNDQAGVCGVISFDKLEEFAESQGFDPDDYMDMDKCDVGESVYDGAAYIYTRIRSSIKRDIFRSQWKTIC